MKNKTFHPYELPQSDADAGHLDDAPGSNLGSDRLVTLATCDNPFDAHLLRNELRSCGINAGLRYPIPQYLPFCPLLPFRLQGSQ